VCIALCTIVAHDIAQNRADNFPSYTPDNHHCSDDDVFEGRGSYCDYKAATKHGCPVDGVALFTCAVPEVYGTSKE